jgi:phage repressor protein C with HTH and peptisase S24 domain
MEENLLKKFRKRAGYSQREVAEALHVTQGAVSSWEAGRWEPDQQNLSALADLFGVSVDALIGREVIEPRPAWQEIKVQPELVPEEEVMIPLVASLRCGPGTSAEPFTFIKPVPIPASYARRWGDDLRALVAVGTSMSPTIIPGDILVCRPGADWVDGNVVSVNVDDSDMVKRIFRTSDGGIDLRSDNPEFETIHFTPAELAEDRVHILGRVMIPIPKEL